MVELPPFCNCLFDGWFSEKVLSVPTVVSGSPEVKGRICRDANQLAPQHKTTLYLKSFSILPQGSDAYILFVFHLKYVFLYNNMFI